MGSLRAPNEFVIEPGYLPSQTGSQRGRPGGQVGSGRSRQPAEQSEGLYAEPYSGVQRIATGHRPHPLPVQVGWGDEAILGMIASGFGLTSPRLTPVSPSHRETMVSPSLYATMVLPSPREATASLSQYGIMVSPSLGGSAVYPSPRATMQSVPYSTPRETIESPVTVSAQQLLGLGGIRLVPEEQSISIPLPDEPAQEQPTIWVPTQGVPVHQGADERNATPSTSMQPAKGVAKELTCFDAAKELTSGGVQQEQGPGEVGPREEGKVGGGQEE